MKKKIRNVFLLLIGLVVSLIGIKNVNAATYKIKAGDTINGYYYINQIGSKKHYGTFAYILREDGVPVFCIQPSLTVNANATYNVSTENLLTLVNMTYDQWKTVRNIAYYGYNYGSHTGSKWYMATQMLIWKYSDYNVDSYFTKTLAGTRDDTILKAEMDEIMQLVNNHGVTPSFSNVPIQMSLGQSVTLTDNNGVLSGYDIRNVSGGAVTKNGNKLTITPNSIGELSFSLNNDYNVGNPVEVYYATDSQTVMRKGSIDPIAVNFNINVVGGKIKIIKHDNENNSCTAQGGASLVGAKYGVYNSSGTKVTTLTIGSDCSATSDYLPLDTYTIKELSASTGYLLNNETYTVNVNSSNTFNVNVKEQVIKGRIKLTKVDSENKICKAQGDATLVGAKYEVYDNNNNLVDTLTIGTDCSATSKYLPYGKYTIKEKSASTGYLLNAKIYSAEIKSNETTISVTVEEIVKKGKIRILKFDKDNDNQQAQGQASLVGAKYGVYDKNDNLVDTLVIDKNKQAISKDLPYGNYKVKEIEPSKGYNLDPEVYSVFIAVDGVTIKINSYEKVIENWISILKQYDYVDGNTTFLNAENGITFEIYYPNGNLYDTITTDKNGYATIMMPYGVWKFHQVNTNTGFEKIYDFYVTVDENSEKEQYYSILNNKISAYLRLLKVDSETGQTIAIANTKFKIFNIDTNQYVSQYVGGIVYDTFETDENGEFITYLKLDAGNYKLVEVSSPNGYLLNEDGLEFNIGDGSYYYYTTYGAFVLVRFEDTAIKGQIEIHKSGEKMLIEDGTYKYEKMPLENVKFEIYADEDIKTADGNYMWYRKDQLVQIIYTDEDGYAISDKLPLGRYKVVETATDSDHVLDTTEHIVTLSEKDDRTPIVYESLNLENYLKKGTLEFTKTDLVNGEVIPNTIIEIYTKDDELIFTDKTDENGKIVIQDLKCGEYYILEKEAATGYLITDEKVYFEIKDNGEIVKAEMKNKPILGSLEFSKTDFSTSEPLPNTLIEVYDENDELIFSGRTDDEGMIIINNLRYGKYYILEKEAPEGYQLNTEKMYFEIKEDGEVIKSNMKDEIITGTLEFSKIDISTSEPLPNTLIEIYNENDELIFSGRTNEEGMIVLKDLKYGKYYILEKEAPEGYQLNDEKMYFEIKDNGEIVKATMKDEKIIEVPDTLSNDYYISVVFGVLLTISGIGVIIHEIHKRRK